MSSVSGLDRSQRMNVRRLATNAAWLAFNNRDRVHYTQGSHRWDGIALDLKAWRKQYPKYADCSSFATWCLWNGLDHYGVEDVVNDLSWKGGWTGTMLQNGKRLQDLKNVKRGDCVIYGASPGAHTAIVVGLRNGHPMVISHGSEGGPYFVRYDYRSDINCIRRYI